MTIAIYPGSFDPLTNGHLDILERASKLFDRVIIAVLINPSKQPFLPIDDKIKLIQESVSCFKNVEVDSFSGLTVEYARLKQANALIRGLRAISDFEYEMQMAQMNKSLYKDLETIFLTPKPEFNFISSSLVKEIAKLGADISEYVPDVVNQYLSIKLK
ncbi:MAG: pantetheine-phosphate adenylyltransferase [bacterium]